MVYIPTVWLKNPQNAGKVHALFDECFPGDILSSEDISRQSRISDELQRLGEIEVLRHFKNGEIVFG